MLRILLFTIFAVTLTLAACGGAEQPGTSASTAAITAALAHPDRLEADRETDRRRRPDAVLEFFGIEPGMTVLDLFSGTGYYAEILNRIVGPDGEVWAHNNSPYLSNAEPLEARYGGGRLATVRRFTAENNQLELEGETFDAVLMILTYHDIYFVDDSIGWPQIDGPALLAEVFEAMKPGAVLGVVDHVAPAGSSSDTASTLHRIDPGLARREIEAAGFVFEAESSALRNLNDDLSQSVFADGIRGRTDRFVFRFRKP